MNIGVQESFQIRVFSRYMPRSGIAGSYGNSMFYFIFLKNLHPIHSGCTNYIPTNSIEGKPFLHTPFSGFLCVL